MKTMTCLYVLALSALPALCGAVVSAKEVQSVLSHLYGLRPSYDRCLAKAAAATEATRACVEEELAYQDKRLNKAYRSLMTKLSPPLQAKLTAEEAVWIQYRDNRCASVVDGIDRSELESLGCRVEETGKQASDLEARLFVQ